MRKTFTALTVLAALSLTACGGETTEPVDTTDALEQNDTDAVEETDETEAEETDEVAETDEAEATEVSAPDIAYAQFIDARKENAGTAPTCDAALAVADGATAMGGDGYVFLAVDGEFAALNANPNGSGVMVNFGTVDSTEFGGITENSREYLDTVWGDTPLVKVNADGCSDAGQTVSEFVAANI